MAVTTFAAIDVGSYELELTIYEISPKKGIIQLDRLRKVIGLGKDTYDRGIISYDRVDEMCKLLHRFKAVMAEYQVDDYRACGTSAIREAENRGSRPEIGRNRARIDIRSASSRNIFRHGLHGRFLPGAPSTGDDVSDSGIPGW